MENKNYVEAEVDWQEKKGKIKADGEVAWGVVGLLGLAIAVAGYIAGKKP